MKKLLIVIAVAVLVFTNTACSKPDKKQKISNDVITPVITEMVFYVAPGGKDSWSGTLAQADLLHTDGPFATLERARDAVRQIRAKGDFEGSFKVILRGGTYNRTEPFILQPRDSGTQSNPVIYESWPGEKVIISGGRKITGWQKGDNSLWTVNLQEVKDGKLDFRQMFVNGQRRQRPRFPKEGLSTLSAVPEDMVKRWTADSKATAEDWGQKAFRYNPGDIKKDWTNFADVEFLNMQFWRAVRIPIKSIDDHNNIAILAGQTKFRPLTWTGGYYIENVFEGIDQPGTWYLDRVKGILYYHPLPDEDMNKAEVIVPIARQLVRMEGDADKGLLVSSIIFRGLTFSHTSWTLPAEGYVCPQADWDLPSAIYGDGVVNFRIEQCELSHLGTWGIELRRGCKDNSIIRNTFRDFGAGAIQIGEVKNSDTVAGRTSRNVISDNTCIDGGLVYFGSACIWVGQSGENIVSHNEVAGPFMWGISVGWTWSYFPLQQARDNIVEFNHVHHIGTGILGSHAGIYALGTSPGTIIRNNYIHHIYNSTFWRGAGEGIILDNGCVGLRIEKNVVYEAAAGGFGTNYNCFGNIVENNIFAYGTYYQLTVYGDQPRGKLPIKGEIFARNIVIWNKGPLLSEKDWPIFNTLWDYNLYYNDTGEPVKFMKYSLEEWQELGLDKHSIAADPLFADPGKGDFTLKADSPAFKLGFEPIDISTVGPRK